MPRNQKLYIGLVCIWLVVLIQSGYQAYQAYNRVKQLQLESQCLSSLQNTPHEVLFKDMCTTIYHKVPCELAFDDVDAYLTTAVKRCLQEKGAK